jgi:hypothetical protein
MMSLFRHLPRLPLLVLALSLLAGPVGLANYAWCLDSSGQAEFKVAAAGGRCCPLDDKTQPSTANSSNSMYDQRGCEDAQCLDISSQAHWRSHRSRSVLAKIFLPPAVPGFIITAVTPPIIKAISGNLKFCILPRLSDAISLHRTVVLLI